LCTTKSPPAEVLGNGTGEPAGSGVCSSDRFAR
jgi:hypothetical protein